MKNIKAEVITIGDEILFGQITDTNTQFISYELSKIGIKVVRKSSVGDEEQEILQILTEASLRADVIILTGGLGPTKDDITKTTIAKFFGVGLHTHQPTLEMVSDFFIKRGREMLEVNYRQADVPQNCEVLLNKVGTAPGMWFEVDGKIYVSLPGVPYEMKYLIQEYVLNKLKTYFKTPFISHRMIHTVGMGESFLAEKIVDWENNLPSHIKLAYLPSLGIVKLRLTATGKDGEHINNELTNQEEKLVQLIQPYIFGYGEGEKLESAIGVLLTKQSLTLATAESCTGGYLAHLITSIPGSSVYYKGSVIAYSNEIKSQELGVSTTILKEKGAVSKETVKAMAEGVRLKLGTDIGIATSGIAGPDGGTTEKPVGTVWIAYADENKTVAKKFLFGSLRENNIKLAAIYALNLIRLNKRV
jgi:nicotinamide-nucleotide amidase